MHTECTVWVGPFLSERARLTRHDALAFSSPKTQAGAYCISQTSFAIRLIDLALGLDLVYPSLTSPQSLTGRRQCHLPLGTNSYWIALAGLMG